MGGSKPNLTSGDLSIRTSLIRDNADPRFARLIEIYQASFDPLVQKSPTVIREMMGDARYSFHVLEVMGGVIGFAIVFTPADREFWLLEYIAIEAARRDVGIGTEFFMSVANAMSNENPGACGVLEVDQAAGDANAVAQARRRLSFYARCGCKMVQELTYILPLGSPGKHHAMHILIWGSPCSAVSKETLTRWLRTIYSEVYSQPRSDLRISKMVSDLSEKIELVSDF
jgi:hypothetical protein